MQFGIDVYTSGNRSSIDIENSNRINATSTGDDVGAIGIYASTRGDLSGIVVENDGIIQTRATALYDATATGIEARAFSAGVTINNRASISAIAQETENYFGATARGINADAYLNIAIDNRGDVTAQAISGTNTTAVGISADSFAGAVRIKNRGDVVATAVGTPSYAAGISADAGRDVAIENHGDITATATIGFGILAYAGGSIAITNSGALKATTNGIDAYSDACLCTPTEIVIVNSGDIEAGVDGIYAAAYGGSINVANAGAIQAGVYGIHAGGGSPYAYGPVAIVNSGQINAGEIGILGITGSNAFSSYAPYGQGGSLFIANAGPVTGSLAGIVATAAGNNAPVTVVNAGKVKANQIGIYAATGIETYVCGCGYGPPIFLPTGYGANSPVTIFNGQHRSRHRHQGGRSRCQQPDFDL